MTSHSTLNYYVIVLAVTLTLTLVYGERFYESRDHSDQEEYETRRKAAVVHTEYQAENWLKKYGYLGKCRAQRRRRRRELTDEDFLDDITEQGHNKATGSLRGNLIRECTQAEVTKALLTYQKRYNLPQSGVLDKATKEHMNIRRCGNKDTDGDVDVPDIVTTVKPPSVRKRRSAPVIPEGSALSSHHLNKQTGDETTVSRRAHRMRTLREIMRTKRRRTKRSLVMNANHTAKVMFSKRLVTYRILESGYSTKISPSQQWQILDLAFRMWSEVIPILFEARPHGDVLKVDVEVAFGTGAHQNCYHDFDGYGGEVAHAWKAGDMHLDDDENYKEQNTDPDGINFLAVAIHEIGHILGLNHSVRENSIMNGVYRVTMSKTVELGWQDRKEVQKIYGQCNGSFNLIMDWVRETVDGKRVFNTYFFRKHRYWMYENKENRTRYGDPQNIQSQWKNVPHDLDGYVHLYYWNMRRMGVEDTQYFFKGCYVYEYDPRNDMVVRGWPKLISQVFPNVPCHIDSAFFDPRDRMLYFFKNNRVYVHNPQSSQCCFRNSTLKSEFPDMPRSARPLPNKLDAVYYSYSDDAQYFVKGDHLWENVRFGRRKAPGRNRIKYVGRWMDKWFDICDVD